jgi:hypothetical protein
MLESKIKLLVNHIKDQVAIFGANGFYIDHFKEYEDGIDGPTDTLENYFIIQQKHKTTADEYRFSEGKNSDTYGTSNVYQIIAGLGCVNKKNAIQALVNTIKSYPGIEAQILSASFNSELIYKSLYQKRYTTKDQNLIMIEFIASDLFLVGDNCEISFCEDCCARTDEGTCWCGCFTN